MRAGNSGDAAAGPEWQPLISEGGTIEAKSDRSPKHSSATIHIPIEVMAEIVKYLCLAFSSSSLYSLNHPVAARYIDEAWKHLAKILDQYEDIALNMAEGKLLFEGIALEEKNPSVQKLSHHFENLHVNSLSFVKGLDRREFDAFFRVFFGKVTVAANVQDLEAIFQREDIRHIHLNAAVYRLIREDEKVVSADAQIISGGLIPEGVESELFHYFMDEVLKRAVQPKELLMRMKNDPVELAGQLVKLLQHADTTLENVESEQVLRTLLENIEVVSESIAHSELKSDPRQQEEMAKALSTLEMELSRKSKRLASGRATKFVKRITDVIASYADTSRAEAVLTEFLEHENSLKSAEKMLKEIAPDADSSHRLLARLKQIMDERHIEADQLLDMISEEVKSKPVPQKKVSKNFAPLADRIQKRLHKAFQDSDVDEDKMLHYLDTVLSREVGRAVREQTTKLKKRLARTETSLHNLEDIIAHTEIGAVVLDDQEHVLSVIHNELVPDLCTGEPLPQDLHDGLKEMEENTVLEYRDVIRVIEVAKTAHGQIRSFLFLGLENSNPEPEPSVE